jgi:hypothetical protein
MTLKFNVISSFVQFGANPAINDVSDAINPAPASQSFGYPVVSLIIKSLVDDVILNLMGALSLVDYNKFIWQKTDYSSII